MKAIVLAGGIGERLRPLTLDMPKPMLSIGGKPIVQRCIDNLKKHGVREVILSVGYLADKFEKHFGDGEKFGVNIKYNFEKELLGTGGAVRECVKKFGIEEDFVLVWADNLAEFDFKGMFEEHRKNESKVTMALTKREDVENFGVVDIQDGKIQGFVEKPKREEAPSDFISAGAFVVSPEVLNMLPEGKSNIERHCFEIIAKERKVGGFVHEGYWYPTDTMEKYLLAHKMMSPITDDLLGGEKKIFFI